uniref:Uncharacterized protein n=1 Tax=Ditylenchus dipsaci TaxID=166011 RepID=A0A915DSE0_9BILA
MPAVSNSIRVAWMFNPHYGYYNDVGDTTNVVQKTVFLQALLICSANACTAALFFCMALFDMSNDMLYVSTYVWCMAHGIPSVIYIFLNKTIRRRCLEMLIGKQGLQNTAELHPKHKFP